MVKQYVRKGPSIYIELISPSCPKLMEYVFQILVYILRMEEVIDKSKEWKVSKRALVI